MSAGDRHPAWLVLATGILITMVAIVFARLAYGLILPSMRAGLGLSYGEAANLASASALGYLSLVMLAGALAARRGARLSVTLGITLLSLGFIGMALSSQYGWLLVFMLLLGVGTAFSYTPAVSLLASWFPERRGLVIGLMSSGVGMGMLMVGLLVPRLDAAVGAAGWRWIWALFALLAIVCLAAVLSFLPRTPGRGNAPVISRPGAAAVEVFRNRRVVAVGALYGVTGMIYIVQATFMYSFTLEAGIEPALAGLLAAAMGVLSIPAGPVWGVASDRIGRGRSILLTMSIALVAVLVPVFWPSLWGFAFHYAALGLTMAGLFTSILAAASEEVDPHRAPLAVSYVTFFFASGQLLGPFAAGLIIEFSGGFRAVFALAAALIATGIVIALRFQRGSRHSPGKPPALP